jgi:hypothetical protein
VRTTGRIERFAETRGAPPRLAVSYVRNILREARHLEATWDGELIHSDPRRDVGGDPYVFRLPDARLLTIRLVVMHVVRSGIDVRIDGRPLPESAYDPVPYVRRSARILACLALLRFAVAAPAAIDGITGVFGWYSAKEFVGWFVAEALLAMFLLAPAVGIWLGSRGWALAALVAAGVCSHFLFFTQGFFVLFAPLDVATLLCASDAFDRIRQFAKDGLTVGS